jgi:protein-S-isoprenylcysteine O-methyltransferase Ste14
MIVLRAILVSGLVLHKVVWEVWKRKDGVAASTTAPATLVKRLLKEAKVAFLVFLVLQAAALDVLPLPASWSASRSAGLILFAIGLGMSVAGRIQLGNNWSNIEDGQVHTDQALESGGIYHFIRHPIYAGDTVLLFGLELALSSWLVLAMFGPLLIFVRRALAEEAMLLQAFPGYESYRQRTKRFIPFVF